MPSNTDDGIVVVARAIREAQLDAPLSDDNWRESWAWHTDPETIHKGGSWEVMRCAEAAIAAYESHLRDKGMVVVPREMLEECHALLRDLGDEPSTDISYNDSITFVTAQLAASLSASIREAR